MRRRKKPTPGGCVRPLELNGVPSIEYLTHINAIQPPLVRVYQLVPELSLSGPRMGVKLAPERICRRLILGLPGIIVSSKESQLRLVGGFL
jgi:hypothetical protein